MPSFPGDMDDADRAWITSMTPEGGGRKVPDHAVITGVLGIVTWINPETGQIQWTSSHNIEMPVTQTIGLLTRIAWEMCHFLGPAPGQPGSGYDIDDLQPE